MKTVLLDPADAVMRIEECWRDFCADPPYEAEKADAQ